MKLDLRIFYTKYESVSFVYIPKSKTSRLESKKADFGRRGLSKTVIRNECGRILKDFYFNQSIKALKANHCLYRHIFGLLQVNYKCLIQVTNLLAAQYSVCIKRMKRHIIHLWIVGHDKWW